MYKRQAINFTVTDLDERWVLRLSNRTLHSVGGRHDSEAAVAFTLAKEVLLDVVRGTTTFAGAVAAGVARAEGDVAAADTVFGHLDVFMNNFPLVEP